MNDQSKILWNTESLSQVSPCSFEFCPEHIPRATHQRYLGRTETQAQGVCSGAASGGPGSWVFAHCCSLWNLHTGFPSPSLWRGTPAQAQTRVLCSWSVCVRGSERVIPALPGGTFCHLYTPLTVLWGADSVASGKSILRAPPSGSKVRVCEALSILKSLSLGWRPSHCCPLLTDGVSEYGTHWFTKIGELAQGRAPPYTSACCFCVERIPELY